MTSFLNIKQAIMLSCVIFLLSLPVIFSTAVPEHLTSATFADTLKQNPVVVVMFYASWCSISKNLQEPYDNLYSEMKDNGILLTKIDCIDQADLYWQYDIKGFPSFGIFVDNEYIMYEGEPEIEKIKEYIYDTSSNKIKQLNPKMFYDLDLTKNPLAIEFKDVSSANGEDIVASTKFDMACKKFNFPHCFTSNSAEFALMLGVQIPSYVILKEYINYNNVPEEVIETSTKAYADSNELLDWMRGVSFPPLIEHVEANHPMIFFDKRRGFEVHCILFINNKQSAVSVPILQDATAVAEEFMNKLVFTYIDYSTSVERAMNLMEDVELGASDIPTAVIVSSGKNAIRFYKLPSGTDISAASLTHWLKQYFNHELKHDKLVGEE